MPLSPPLAGKVVLILGAGVIGTGFAAVFSAAGAAVTLTDPDPVRRAEALLGLETAALALAQAGRGGAGGLSVTVAADATPATIYAAHLIIECGPELLGAKQAILAAVLPAARADVVVATASSALTISRIVPDQALQARCLVAHPVNPPGVLRLIELVPAPGTDPATTTRAEHLFTAAGFRPVILGREIEGFVLNRLQGAVLREAYRLVGEGIVGPAELDLVMREGLGPRWALSGPFETADLNTAGGIVAHAARMGPAYRRMGAERGETDTEWSADLVAQVAAVRRAALPTDEVPARVAWRARALAEITALRDRLLTEAPTDREPR